MLAGTRRRGRRAAPSLYSGRARWLPGQPSLRLGSCLWPARPWSGKEPSLHLTRGGLTGVLFPGEAAIAPAVEEVDHESQDHPYHEPGPRRHWQADHQVEADQGGQDGDHRDPGRTEGAPEVGLCPAKNDYPYGDQDEGEERTYVCQLRELLQVYEARHQGHNYPSQDGYAVGGAEAWMGSGKEHGEKVIPA